MERRGVERFDLEIPAKIQVEAAEMDPEGFDLLTENISSGGAYFRTSQPLPEGTELKIELILRLDRLQAFRGDISHVHVELKGKVVRCEDAGMSVCFDPKYRIRPWQALTKA